MIDQAAHESNVRGLTSDEACVKARTALCKLDSGWCQASCQRITDELKKNCSLFGGTNDIRCALAPGTCGSNCAPPPPPPPPPGDDTTACAAARAALVQLDRGWTTATCAQITAEVTKNCSLFIGNNNPVRCALAPGTCGVTCTAAPPPPPLPPPPAAAGDNTLLILAGAGMVTALAALMINRGSKKVMIARIAPK